MDIKTVQDRYLKVTRRFARLVGVWPYQTNNTKYIRRLLLFIIVLPSLVTQMAKVVVFYTPDILLEQCPYFFATCGILIKHINYIINERKIKTILESIFEDWATERSEKEFDILNTHSMRSVFFTSLYLGNAFISGLLFLQMPVIPHILDLIVPLNHSRDPVYIFPAYYGLNEEEYYYFIIAHMSIIVGSVYVVYVTYDTTYMYVIQHACGLLAVSGYRFRSAVRDIVASNEGDAFKLGNETYRRICSAIQAHQRAMNCIKDIQLIYETYLLVLVTLTIVALSLTLFKVAAMEICADFFKFFSFLIIQIIHLFIMTSPGQFVENSSENFYKGVYDALWYNTTTKVQALYILPLRRSLVPSTITAGGIVTMNLKTFLEVMKTSVSYFTVLRSTCKET